MGTMYKFGLEGLWLSLFDWWGEDHPNPAIMENLQPKNFQGQSDYLILLHKASQERL